MLMLMLSMFPVLFLVALFVIACIDTKQKIYKHIKEVGIAICNKCGYTGYLIGKLGGKLVCVRCGGEDWKKIT